MSRTPVAASLSGVCLGASSPSPALSNTRTRLLGILFRFLLVSEASVETSAVSLAVAPLKVVKLFTLVAFKTFLSGFPFLCGLELINCEVSWEFSSY